MAVVLLDQGEREIHARGDARGRPEFAVAHVDRLRVDLDARIFVRKPLAPPPVRDRAAAVEQAGGGQNERAGADRGNASRPACETPYRVAQLRLMIADAGALPTADDEGVDRSPVCQQLGKRAARREQAAPERASGMRLALRRHRQDRDLDVIERRVGIAGSALQRAEHAAGLAEHLGGPGNVEGLNRRERHDQHPPRGAGTIRRWDCRRHGREDRRCGLWQQ